MTIKMQFPTGCAFITDPHTGVEIIPDALGQMDAPADDFGFYIQNGFLPVAYATALAAGVAKDVLQDAADALKIPLTYLDTTVTLGNSDVKIPTQKAVKAYCDSLTPGGALQGAAMSGNMVFVATPATLSTAHAAAATRTVTISLKNAAGDVHTWFNKAITAGVAIAKSSVAGTATIVSTTLTFVNGVASVVITEGGTWAGTDTNTLTVAAAVILGYTVASVTSVETMT